MSEGRADETPSSAPALTSDAEALLAVVHDFGSSGTATDTAASDLSAGPPWFGLQRAAEELEAAGLVEIDREMANEGAPVSHRASQPYFLSVTEAGRALVHERRR